MPLAVACSCGSVFQLGDELAGRKIRCKTCRTILEVPARTVSKIAAAPSPPQPSRTFNQSEPEADESYDMKFLPRARTVPEPAADRESAESPPRKSKKKKSKKRRGDHADAGYDRRSDAERLDDAYGRMGESMVRGGGGWAGDARAVVGGVLAMILAVVWFFVGLHFGWVYFYPPILFIIGLGAVIKGLTGGGD